MKCNTTVIIAAVLMGCSPIERDLRSISRTEPSTKPFEKWKVQIHNEPDFVSENRYVSVRRQAAGVVASEGAVGLAFSGGGLRSATINLGVLQELERQGKLARVDYLSAVSGGSYIASWFVSHLAPATAHGRFADNLQHPSYTSDRRALLALQGSPAIEHLMDERGFVLGKANWKVLPIAGIIGATIPVNAVFDLALHFKPAKGKFNWYHPNFFYDYFIRKTYLESPEYLLPGQEVNEAFFGNAPHDVRLNELNAMGSAAPYLIINCALGNVRRGNHTTENLPFEFSRYSCGAQALGYIPAKHFGFPVEGTYETNKSRFSVMRPNSMWLVPPTKPLRLSSAVAASGAAVDAAGMNREIPCQPRQIGKTVNAPIVTNHKLSWDLLLAPFNLNLRYQNRNFAMAITRNKEQPGGNPSIEVLDWKEPQHDFLDRGREVTLDRYAANVYSNGLYLTDGAHYDNLGIFALLQRPQIKSIWSIDAGEDGSYKFGDIQHIKELAYYAGWDFEWVGAPPCKCTFAKSDAGGGTPERLLSPVFEATLKRQGRVVTLFYVKSSYKQGDGADENAREFLAEFKSGTPGKLGSSHANFPHTSTANLSFNRNDFNAYREIGRALAYQLAPHLKE